MPNRARDWFRQAESDLDHACSARQTGHHDWACFAAHQAAEKALKSVHLRHLQDAWGHDLTRLLGSLPVEVPAVLVERARSLDQHYVPARYPNGFPEGTSFEHYGPLHSERAIQDARAIVEFARLSLA